MGRERRFKHGCWVSVFGEPCTLRQLLSLCCILFGLVCLESFTPLAWYSPGMATWWEHKENENAQHRVFRRRISWVPRSTFSHSISAARPRRSWNLRVRRVQDVRICAHDENMEQAWKGKEGVKDWEEESERKSLMQREAGARTGQTMRASAGWRSGWGLTSAQEVLRNRLEERGLKLFPCGQDCLGAIAQCIHLANIPNLGPDSPDVERTLRRLAADILLYASSHFSSANYAAGVSFAFPGQGMWLDDLFLEACAQVLGVKIVCYKCSETAELDGRSAAGLQGPYLCENVFTPNALTPHVAIHLALGLGAGVKGASEEVQRRTFHAQVVPIVSSHMVDSSRKERLKVLWIFFDLESTGLDTSSDAIIQIGANAIYTECAEQCTEEKGDLGWEAEKSACFAAGVFNCGVNPHEPMSEGASDVTGITSDMLAIYPAVPEQALHFMQWLQALQLLFRDSNDQSVQTVMVAHNGDYFDFPLLAAELHRSALLQGAWLESWREIILWDSLPFFRNREVADSELGEERGPVGRRRSCRLGDLYLSSFGEELEGAHDALTDVGGLARVTLAQPLGPDDEKERSVRSNLQEWCSNPDASGTRLRQVMRDVAVHGRQAHYYFTSQVTAHLLRSPLQACKKIGGGVGGVQTNNEASEDWDTFIEELGGSLS
jgi:hypothetical protein